MDTTTELYSRIQKLKNEKNVVILAHYYMPPELQMLEKEGGVVDYIGDSLGLSIEALKTKADNIVFCGVLFMAETAKILNPHRHVFIPDKEAGCSLAASITGEDVRKLKQQYPGVPVMAYINTYAETKAECDICCTSRNAVDIIKSLEADTVIFLPDKYMGENLSRRIAAETGKKLILWDGACEVHEQFRPDSIGALEKLYPEAEMLLHWEVPQETVVGSLDDRGGVLGSTTDILRYVGQSKSRQFILASECDLGATLKSMYADREFITPCIKCPYMKKITLENTLNTLEAMGTPAESRYEITLDAKVMKKAYLPIKRMLEFS
ncbi:quinolinate synthase NadA [Oscillatoria amoena NRMC-F 0135]|nr:quinolinate synthase NadA [Oscillatoria amoena NRMC-F 0135]